SDCQPGNTTGKNYSDERAHVAACRERPCVSNRIGIIVLTRRAENTTRGQARLGWLLRQAAAMMNPWKLTVIVMALVASTAIVTGLVVARWSASDTSQEAKEATAPPPVPPAQAPQPTPRPAPAVKPQPVPVQQAAATPAGVQVTTPAPPPSPAAATAPPPPAPPTVSPQPSPAPAATVPTQEAIDACNRYATEQLGDRSKTKETVTDALIGAVAGAAIGAAGGGIAGGGKGAGKGAAIGGVVGAAGGTLYGLNEGKKHDEAYRAAYSSCMRGRGYPG